MKQSKFDNAKEIDLFDSLSIEETTESDIMAYIATKTVASATVF